MRRRGMMVCEGGMTAAVVKTGGGERGNTDWNMERFKRVASSIPKQVGGKGHVYSLVPKGN